MKTMTEKKVTIYEAKRMVFEQPKRPANAKDKPIEWPELGQQKPRRKIRKDVDQRDITRKKENDKEDYNNSKFYSRRIEREKISNSEDKTNYEVKWKRQQDTVRVHSTIQNKDGSEEKGKQEMSSILNIIKETMKSLTQNIMKLKEKEVPQEAANIFMEFEHKKLGRMSELCKETRSNDTKQLCKLHRTEEDTGNAITMMGKEEDIGETKSLKLCTD